MKPITFAEALKHINTLKSSLPIEIETLARQSNLQLMGTENNVIIFLSSERKEYHITNDLWDAVMLRIGSIPDEWKEMTSTYGRNNTERNWSDCPDAIICPYIPAILRYLNE